MGIITQKCCIDIAITGGEKEREKLRSTGDHVSQAVGIGDDIRTEGGFEAADEGAEAAVVARFAPDFKTELLVGDDTAFAASSVRMRRRFFSERMIVRPSCVNRSLWVS